MWKPVRSSTEQSRRQAVNTECQKQIRGKGHVQMVQRETTVTGPQSRTGAPRQGGDSGCCLMHICYDWQGPRRWSNSDNTKTDWGTVWSEALHYQRRTAKRASKSELLHPNRKVPTKKSKHLITMTVVTSLIIIIIIIIIIIHFSYCPAVLLVLKTVTVSLTKHFLLTVRPKIL